jgi:hypothetical protein
MAKAGVGVRTIVVSLETGEGTVALAAVLPERAVAEGRGAEAVIPTTGGREGVETGRGFSRAGAMGV